MSLCQACAKGPIVGVYRPESLFDELCTPLPPSLPLVVLCAATVNELPPNPARCRSPSRSFPSLRRWICMASRIGSKSFIMIVRLSPSQSIRSAAYSLSGHIQISLSSTTGFFDRRRVSSFLLQSLTVTFEGQTELISEETGYSAFRLCSVVQELVTGEPIELSNEGHEDPAQPCTWNIVFNLTVPGWLPESSCFGEREGGTRYSLHASATIQSIEDSASGSWLSTFCSPFRSHSRVIRARRARLTLNRFMSPSERASTSSSIWPIAHYGVSPQPEHLHEGSQFPADVLSKIRVQVSIPECVGTDEGNIPFTLRLRTNDLSQSECRRLRVETFDVDLEQSERYRYVRFQKYP